MADEEQQQASKVDYWLVTDRALIWEEAEVVERAVSIGVVGASIASLRPVEELRGEFGEGEIRRGVELIDVRDSPVVPSFVNGHCHLAMAPLRGVTSLATRQGNVISDVFFQLERHLTPEDVYAFTRMGAFESLLSGVGEVWDHYYFGEQVACALKDVGLGGVVAPTLQDLSGPGTAQTEQTLLATEAIAQTEGYGRCGIRAALGPHASDTVSDRLFGEVRSLASRLELPVHLHLAQSSDEVQSGEERFPNGLVLGVKERLSGLRTLAAHGLYFEDADCAPLIDAGWVLAYCPNSQLQFGTLSPVRSWLKGGGRLALGTDCVASNDALDVQRELPLLGGEAALQASFSKQSSRVAQGGTSQKRAERANRLEQCRRESLEQLSMAEPSRLLEVAWGRSLDGVRGASAGITLGATANLLVLNPEHPSLFPDDDLPRTLAYGQTAGAIDWSICSGKIHGRRDGLAQEILNSELYRETLYEARRRRGELLERAKMTAAPHSSSGGSCQRR